MVQGLGADLGTYPAAAFITVAPCCNNQHALLWEEAGNAPVDLNSLLPVDSPWYIVSAAGITNAGEIAATAVNLNTFEVHAVLVSPITGVGPAARGAIRAPALPESVKRTLQQHMHL